MSKQIHIALDFDKTLAYYESHLGISQVGRPLMGMVELVESWLAKGYKVSIFTARVSCDKSLNLIAEQKRMIEKFLQDAGLPILPITANKYPYFTHFIDDKAYQARANYGEIWTHLDI